MMKAHITLCDYLLVKVALITDGGVKATESNELCSQHLPNVEIPFNLHSPGRGRRPNLIRPVSARAARSILILRRRTAGRIVGGRGRREKARCVVPFSKRERESEGRGTDRRLPTC